MEHEKIFLLTVPDFKRNTWVGNDVRYINWRTKIQHLYKEPGTKSNKHLKIKIECYSVGTSIDKFAVSFIVQCIPVIPQFPHTFCEKEAALPVKTTLATLLLQVFSIMLFFNEGCFFSFSSADNVQLGTPIIYSHWDPCVEYAIRLQNSGWQGLKKLMFSYVARYYRIIDVCRHVWNISANARVLK